MKKQKKAVILLSGGLDSSTVLYVAKNAGFKCHCLIFDYGQRHIKEIASAKIIAKKAGASFTIIKFCLPKNSSSLTSISAGIPKHNNISKIGSIPTTYVPGRNTIFLSFALSFAEIIHASSIYIGANSIDFSGYPDCRPAYFKAWQKLIYALGKDIKLATPLLHLTKSQIVKLGNKLEVPFESTWSCYRGLKNPCGICDSCKFREKGFRAAHVVDPLLKMK